MRMRYEGAGGRREWIWNSRDGITPFVIGAQDDPNVELHHGNWHLDQYLPAYVPPIGSRVFIDLTEEIARPLAVEYVDRHWESPEMPMKDHPVFEPLGKEGAAEYFVKAWIADWGGHPPHVAIVTEAMREQFKARAIAIVQHGAKP